MLFTFVAIVPEQCMMHSRYHGVVKSHQKYNLTSEFESWLYHLLDWFKLSHLPDSVYLMHEMEIIIPNCQCF